MFKFLLASFLTLGALQYTCGQLIPPIDDPLYITDVEANLDSLAPTASGTVSLCSGVVTGLGGLTSGVQVLPGGIGAINIRAAFGLPSVEINGYYTSDITLSLSELLPIIPVDLELIGQGALLAGLTYGNVTVVANLPYLGQARIRSLEIVIDFGSAYANLEGLKLNGDLIDFDSLNENIKPIFDFVWGSNKGAIIESILTLVNGIISDCTVAEFIGIIVGNGTAECLNLPTPPEPMSLLGAMSPENPLCQVLVPTTETPDVDPSTESADEETTTEDGGPGPIVQTSTEGEGPGPTGSTEGEGPGPVVTTPSSSVELKPFMYLFLLIAAANVLHLIN